MHIAKPLIAAVAAALALPAVAPELVLKLHHFLPPQATIQAQVFNPWCEKIGKESGGKIKCQIYPAMQLGGTPPQLFDRRATASPTSCGRSPRTRRAASSSRKCSSSRSWRIMRRRAARRCGTT